MWDCSPIPVEVGAIGEQRFMKLANAVIHIIPQVLYGFKRQQGREGDSPVQLAVLATMSPNTDARHPNQQDTNITICHAHCYV